MNKTGDKYDGEEILGPNRQCDRDGSPATGATTVWQNVTDGELVELFGGVSEATITEVRNGIEQSISGIEQSISGIEQSVPILDAAVTAFDSRAAALTDGGRFPSRRVEW